MPYPNEHACRLRNPDDFKKESFKRTTRKHEGKEYSIIMGRLKGETKLTEQAYRYGKDIWSVSSARTHCKDHGGSFEPASGNNSFNIEMAEGLFQKPKKNESKQGFLNRCTRELIEKKGKDADQAYMICNGLWNDSMMDRIEMNLSMPLEFKDEDDTRSFLITAYTGQRITRFFGDLIIDVKGMKAKNSIPVLREHIRDRVVGHSKKAWNEKSNFYISGNVSKQTLDGKEVAALADEGFPWQASVGIRAQKIESLEQDTEAMVNGQKVKGPLDIWRESMVGEVSFVALGADDRTAAIVLNDQGDETVNIELITSKEEVKPMEVTLQLLETEAPDLLKEIREKAQAGVTIENFKDEVERLRLEATDAERTRIIGIFTEVYGKELAEKFTKVIDPKASMADMMTFAQEKAKADILAQMTKDSPESQGAGTEETETTDQLAGLTGDERLKKEYELSGDLQKEFGNVDRYVAFKNAEAKGVVKILRSKTA